MHRINTAQEVSYSQYQSSVTLFVTEWGKKKKREGWGATFWLICDNLKINSGWKKENIPARNNIYIINKNQFFNNKTSPAWTEGTETWDSNFSILMIKEEILLILLSVTETESFFWKFTHQYLATDLLSFGITLAHEQQRLICHSNCVQQQ